MEECKYSDVPPAKTYNIYSLHDQFDNIKFKIYQINQRCIKYKEIIDISNKFGENEIIS